MSLKNDIINNWKTDIVGQAQAISQLKAEGYPGWTVKYPDAYGVAIPYEGSEDINEFFSNAHIKSDILIVKDGSEQRAVILTADFSVAQRPFATLCEELIFPGENGKNRNSISRSPVGWWKEWKELIGNRDIDDLVYDTLGELCAMKYLLSIGKEVSWDGPNAATYDIEVDDGFVEVKSTTSRSKKEISISSQFQLAPPEKKLDLVLCQFERSAINGISIDQVVSDIIDFGISKDYLNQRLSKKGLDEGMSARKRTFILHDMLKYEINDDFPRITPSSFIGGVMPVGITKITYTVDLSGLIPASLLQGDKNDL